MVVYFYKLSYNIDNFFGKSIIYWLGRESMVGENTLRNKLEDIQVTGSG